MSKQVIILVLAVSFLGIFGLDFLTEAGSGENVSGYAWSENIGWLSFNSTNCDSDGDGITDTGNYPNCPTSQSISSYGVNIDSGSGKLSGHAWSAESSGDYIGWISFDESDTGSPPSDDPCSDESCIAKINPPGQLGKSDVFIEGWARVLACCDSVPCTSSGACSNCGGWDGWIRFDHGRADEPYIDIDGDWHGWAWGDMVVGWISFNGADPDAGGNYKVTLGQVNHPPTATNLQNTASVVDYCSESPNNIFLGWQFNDDDSGDSQSAYEIEVTRESDNQTKTTGKQTSSASSVAVFTVNSLIGEQFIWYDSSEQGYTWKIKVWDSQDTESDWSDTDSFNTPKHRYPSSIEDFSWSPTKPSAEEDVVFTDHSTVYGGSTKSAWSWIFEDGNPATSDEQNPVIQFTKSGEHQVTLEVTDSDNYACPATKTVGAQAELPGWQEILPR